MDKVMTTEEWQQLHLEMLRSAARAMQMSITAEAKAHIAGVK